MVELTRNSDIDSLEVSLLTTIAEYVPCRVIEIYHGRMSGSNLTIVRAVGLTIQSNNPNFNWVMCEPVTAPPYQLIDCLKNSRAITCNNDDNTTQLWMPVLSGEFRACLFIEALHFQPESKTLISGFSRVYGNYQKVLAESERDKLTGLLNRHSFERRLQQMLNVQANMQKQVGEKIPARHLHETDLPYLAMIDIDHFKKINDEFGHVCGDEVLLTLAQKMLASFRSTDLLFRFGGEEFVLILEPVRFEDAAAKLQSFCEQISQETFPLVEKLTVSIGFTKINAGDFETMILEKADRALYYVKENGRNGVANFEKLIESGKLKDSQETTEVDLF